MPTKSPFISYEQRLNRVITHIYEHLDEDLSLDTLAEIACMSRYHWHRVFKAMTGETLAGVVRRLRLNKAANALVQENTPVRDIAKQAGFKNLASFSRAFKKAHGVSPNEFRLLDAKVVNALALREGAEKMHPVSIKNIHGFKAAGVCHVGPYQQIGKAFRTLGSLLMARSLLPQVGMLFSIYHDAPDSRPSVEFRSHVAVSINEGFPENMDELDYFEVSGGRYAVLEHTGPYPTLKAAYEWLYGTWLPQSGEEPRDTPPLEVYMNDPKTTPAKELRTDIRLPLK